MIEKLIGLFKRVCRGVYYRSKYALISLRHEPKQMLMRLFNIGYICNVCDKRSLRFESDNWHLYTICPHCKCQVRHRLFWAVVNRVPEFHIDKILRHKRILHFSPYYHVSLKLRKIAALYTTADFLDGGYNFGNIELDLDMSEMSEIETGTYDALLAFDVLEHVEHHFKALDEINRVLAIGGYCILIVPQRDNLEKTIDDPSVTDPQQREELYGRNDHLRMYGLDFKEMIEERGFEVTVVDEKFFRKKELKKYVLFPPILSDHPNVTNYRKVYFGRKIRNL